MNEAARIRDLEEFLMDPSKFIPYRNCPVSSLLVNMMDYSLSLDLICNIAAKHHLIVRDVYDRDYIYFETIPDYEKFEIILLYISLIETCNKDLLEPQIITLIQEYSRYQETYFASNIQSLDPIYRRKIN